MALFKYAQVVCVVLGVHFAAGHVPNYATIYLNATQCSAYSEHSSEYIEPSYAVIDNVRSCTFETGYSCLYSCADVACAHISSEIVRRCTANSTMSIDLALLDQLNSQCKQCSNNVFSATPDAPTARTAQTTTKPLVVHRKRNYRILYAVIIGMWLVALCVTLECSRATEADTDMHPPSYKHATIDSP